MNLTQLVSYIGQNDSKVLDNPFSSIIKDDIKALKADETYYIVNMVFDLDNNYIDFELNCKYSEEAKQEFYYFGNNFRASTQFYLVRQTAYLNYLLGGVLSNLYIMLEGEGLSSGSLGTMLKSMEDKGLIIIKPGKGNGHVSLNNIKYIKDNNIKHCEINKKQITLDDKKYNYEAFIKLVLKDENKKNKIAMIVPAVRNKGKFEYLHDLEGYLELVKLVNNLEISESTENEGCEGKVCYICGKIKNDVSSSYSTRFDGSCINKIFTTTTVNSSRLYNKFDYDDVYSICKNCFNNLLNGEKIVSRKFRSRIAGENVFIIPEGIIGSFDYNYMCDLKNNVDIAFRDSEASEMTDYIDHSAYFDKVKSYSLNFIFYRTDGKSFDVLETIEDVPTLRFDKVIQKLSECAKNIDGNMHLGDVYRIIPVRQNNKREQIDIGRVLTVYKSLLQCEKIDANVLYSYAVEALEKGLNQLKGEIKNYSNMDLINFKKYLNFDDIFIKRITMSYLALLRCCQEVNVLNKQVFKFREEDDKLEILVTQSEKINNFINETEKFLDKQGFGQQAKALFYLGTLVNRVAMAQVSKEHKTKPILKKIQFQGMKGNEIYRLYNEVVEKLRQYEIVSQFNEVLMNRFHYYYGSIGQKWELSEQANVFYVMSGYSYMVGGKVQEPPVENANQN